MCTCVRYGSSGVTTCNSECTSHRSGATFENECCTKISTIGYRSNSRPCRNRRGGFLNGDCFGYACCCVVVAITRLGCGDGNRSCFYCGKGIARACDGITCYSITDCTTRSGSRERVGTTYSQLCWRCPSDSLVGFGGGTRNIKSRKKVGSTIIKLYLCLVSSNFIMTVLYIHRNFPVGISKAYRKFFATRIAITRYVFIINGRGGLHNNPS